jgi:hypothetical protein
MNLPNGVFDKSGENSFGPRAGTEHLGDVSGAIQERLSIDRNSANLGAIQLKPDTGVTSV